MTAWHGMFVILRSSYWYLLALLNCADTPSLEKCCLYDEKGKDIFSWRDNCVY